MIKEAIKRFILKTVCEGVTTIKIEDIGLWDVALYYSKIPNWPSIPPNPPPSYARSLMPPQADRPSDSQASARLCLHCGCKLRFANNAPDVAIHERSRKRECENGNTVATWWTGEPTRTMIEDAGPPSTFVQDRLAEALEPGEKCAEVLEGGHTHICEYHESLEHEAQQWKPATHTWQALGMVVSGSDHPVNQQCPRHRKDSPPEFPPNTSVREGDQPK